MKKRIFLINLLCLIYLNIFAQNVIFSNISYDCSYCIDSSNNQIIVDTVFFNFTIYYTDVNIIEEEIGCIWFRYGYIDTTEIQILSSANIFLYNDTLIIATPEKDKWSYGTQSNQFILKKYIKDLQLPVIHYAIFDIEYTRKYHVKYLDKKPIYLG